MESAFLTFILVSSFAVYSSHFSVTEWNDVVVARKGRPITLVCTDTTVRGAIVLNWRVKSPDTNEWKLVLSADERQEFYGGASKASMRLTDPNFKDTGNFSLSFLPKMEDCGLYSCLIKQQERNLKERIILLAILTVTIVPTAPIPQHSTLHLIANVNPKLAISKITWTAPDGIFMKSEKMLKEKEIEMVAKLPQVQNSDDGVYVCSIHPRGNGSIPLFTFNVNVAVAADKVASFNVTHDPTISTATQAQTPFPLTCAGVQGDYVLLYWNPPDTSQKSIMKLVYQYDRWRDSSLMTRQSKKFQLAGQPYNAATGSFSFLITPGLRDGGLYACEVFLNDKAFSQRTLLSVLKVKTNRKSSNLELECLYSERSQINSVRWKYQNESYPLQMFSKQPGSIFIILPLPITSDTAGNYTCTLQLKNGQTIYATQTVTLFPEDGRDESVSVTTPSLLPSLSALLLLVPLVAAAVGVLLWRQKHISDRGIEQSLSVHSREAENIYDNPEDIRQAPPQGSVYMDLKPRGEDDVYKELERYEQCQS